MIHLANGFVLQTAQRKIGLSQEVAATTSWIEESQRREFHLVITQFPLTLFLYLFFQYLV